VQSDEGGSVTSDPVVSLEREWRQLSRAVLPARLRLWAEREPALAPFVDPGRLVAFAHGPAPSASKDELLRALVRLAADDALAARAVLHVLLPGLKRIAGRAMHDLSERDELWELLLAHAWERIRCYPLARRPRHIAANVLLDALKRTMRELERERRRRRRSDAEPAASAPARDSRSEIAHVLLDAVAAGAISQLEARIIFQTRIEHCSLAEVAAEEELAYNALRVRLQRAERRLLLHLGYPDVPNRRAKGPFSSARVVGATRTDRIHTDAQQAG
jgi:DNA-directed RNA polymerase specialized sigma24 family protein